MQIRVIGPLALAFVLAGTVLAGTVVAEERSGLRSGLGGVGGVGGVGGESSVPHPSAVWNDRAANTCFGGLHHRKRVLAEEHLRDERSDTTVTDCVAQGGRTGWLPRFTPVSAGERLG